MCLDRDIGYISNTFFHHCCHYSCCLLVHSFYVGLLIFETGLYYRHLKRNKSMLEEAENREIAILYLKVIACFFFFFFKFLSRTQEE